MLLALLCFCLCTGLWTPTQLLVQQVQGPLWPCQSVLYQAALWGQQQQLAVSGVLRRLHQAARCPCQSCLVVCRTQQPRRHLSRHDWCRERSLQALLPLQTALVRSAE
jgi:hypothetical protein